MSNKSFSTHNKKNSWKVTIIFYQCALKFTFRQNSTKSRTLIVNCFLLKIYKM